jgi:hypothetical protein
MKVSKKAAALKSKVATEADMDHLVEIFLVEEDLRNQLSDEEGIKSYFKDRVLADGHAVLLFDGDTVVAATAPLRFQPNQVRVLGDEERIIMRFTAVRPGYYYAWPRLLLELAKECKKAKWTDIPIQAESWFTASGPAMAGLAEIRPELDDFETIMVKKKE